MRTSVRLGPEDDPRLRRGEPADDRGRFVSRAVVDHNHLAQDRALFQCAADRRLDEAGVVVQGDHDRNPGLVPAENLPPNQAEDGTSPDKNLGYALLRPVCRCLACAGGPTKC